MAYDNKTILGHPV